MASTRISRLWLVAVFVMAVPAWKAHAQETGNVARIVVWQPKPGMARDFEEGYKRHLEWHRQNNDTWAWRGWTISSGTRVDYFVDGTFFHAWTDLDSPVSPAGDGANNALNVEPYADVRALATFEVIPALSNLGQKELGAPLLTFCYFDIAPGHGAEFESLLTNQLSGAPASQHAVMRPVNGTTEYLLLLPGEKQSDLGRQAEIIAHVLQGIGQSTKGPSPVLRYRTETGRYHPELSNVPGEK